MEKLTIKELAPYIPYGVKCCLMGEHDENENPKQFLIEGANTGMVEVWTLKTITDEREYEDVFPILRPLSDLTKEIEHNGEKFVPMSKIYGNPLDYKIKMVSFGVVQKLFEWKFDIFGLLDKNLAVPVTENFDPYK